MIRSIARSRARREPGFSLLELMVTMGLASLLIASGAGVYVKMGRRSAATQAINSVGMLVKRAQNASNRAPATIVADAETNLIHAYTDQVLQELHFETRKTSAGDYTPMGIEGRDCTATGGKLVPDGGHAGGCMRLDGGSVDCGTFSAYDVDQGLNLEMWVRLERSGTVNLVKRGMAYRLSLDARPNGAGELRVALNVQDPSGMQAKVEQNAPIPQVRLGEWLGVRMSYDRTRILLATNEGYGFVTRAEWTSEHRPLARSPDDTLLLAEGLNGWLDDVRIGGIRSTEPLQLPQGVSVFGANPPIRFADGRLDPAAHPGPARLAIQNEGKVHTFEIAQSGNILAVHVTEVADAAAGQVPKRDPGTDPNNGAKRE